MSHYAEVYGVSAKWIANRAELIIEALNEGKPIIAHVGKNVFTEGGHYIVLRGLTDDGRALINDPASAENSAKTYSMYTMVREAGQDNSFMVCWTESKPKEEAGREKATSRRNSSATEPHIIRWRQDIFGPVDKMAKHLNSMVK